MDRSLIIAYAVGLLTPTVFRILMWIVTEFNESRRFKKISKDW